MIALGHSQGGQASWFAAHEAPTYAPELDLFGVVASAPLIDPLAFVRAATTPETVGYSVMIVKGLDAAYPGSDGAAALTPDAAKQSAIVDEQCANEVESAFELPYVDVFARNPGDDPRVASLLERSALPVAGISAPVLVLKGEDDPLLPKPETDTFVQAACAAGTQIDYRVYPGANHNSVYVESVADVATWIADRVIGQAVTGACTPSA